MAHFIHTADLHLGRQFKSFAASIAAELSDARYSVLESLQRLVVETGADFIVIAGDLLDSATPTSRVLAKALQALGKINVPIYCIPGNHDPAGPLGPYHTPIFLDYRQRYAPNLHIITECKPLLLHEHKTVLLPCPIIGSVKLDPSTWLREHEVFADLPKDYARIVLAHGAVRDFSEDARYGSILNLNRIPREEVDYIALGDWHGSLSYSDPAFRYAGTPEADKFPKHDKYLNGLALYLQVERAKPAQIDEHPVGRFEWVELRRTVRDADSIIRLDEELLAPSSKRGRLLRLVLEGSLNVADATALKQTVERLHDAYTHAEIEQRAVLIAPGEEEMQALTRDASNPTVASVATKLSSLIADPEKGSAARLALVKLYEAVQLNNV